MTLPEQANFVVVANRLPVDRVADHKRGEPAWQASPGGLVTALIPVMQSYGGAWVGWPGTPDTTLRSFDFDGYRIVPVSLSSQQVEDYYEGMSNGTFWPLYHDCIVNPQFKQDWWASYREVNRRFARRTAEIAAPGAQVWVQDYQLQLVPAMLRALRPDLTIGFFLHIPFPPIELFMQLPWREEVIDGLLGADVVGFQVPGAAANFRALAERLSAARVQSDGDVVTREGRRVRAAAYPISIDSRALLDLSRSPATRAAEAQLRADLGNPKRVFLGVDRLDYTKGLRRRVAAFGELYAQGRLDPENDVYLQLATPSRERVEDYRILRDEIDTTVGRLYSQTGRLGASAIQYRYTSVDKETLAAMYRIADVCVVTPLRDGMNLVAKEYVVAHDSDDGALVLSEFAGAARELTDAYLVNPYDILGLERQLLAPGRDTVHHRRERMARLRAQVMEYDVQRWAGDFLRDLRSTAQQG